MRQSPGELWVWVFFPTKVNSAISEYAAMEKYILPILKYYVKLFF